MLVFTPSTYYSANLHAHLPFSVYMFNPERTRAKKVPV